MNARVVQIVLGIVCTIFFLALAFYRVPVAAVGTLLASAHLDWIAAAFLIYAVDLLLRGWRWRIILRPLVAISYPDVTRALLVGYGLNAIMPARLGELLRAEFLKQSYGVSRVWALSSIVIERLFDGMTVVACLGIGLLFSSASSKSSGLLIGVLMTAALVFGVILLVAVVLVRIPMSRVLHRFPELAAQATMVQRGLEVLRTWRTLEIAAFTLIICLLDGVTLWCIVTSVGLRLDLSHTLVLLGTSSLSTLVPSGPAFLGTLQFGYALAIEFAGAPRALGIAAATIAQLSLLLPLSIIATAILLHRSGSMLRFILAKRDPDTASADR